MVAPLIGTVTDVSLFVVLVVAETFVQFPEDEKSVIVCCNTKFVAQLGQARPMPCSAAQILSDGTGLIMIVPLI